MEGMLRQQLLDLGYSPEKAETPLRELRKIISEASAVEDQSRERKLDLEALCQLVCRLLGTQRLESLTTEKERRAQRRKEIRDLRSGGYRLNKESGVRHYFRPAVTPSQRGTSQRADVRCELMHYFLFWDGNRDKDEPRTKRRPVIDSKDQLISFWSAAREVSRILFLFELEAPQRDKAKERLGQIMAKENKALIREGHRSRTAKDISAILASGREEANLHEIEIDILAEKIFDAYKQWNSTQISGLPRGVHSTTTVLRPDGKRDFQFDMREEAIRKAQVKSRFRSDVRR